MSNRQNKSCLELSAFLDGELPPKETARLQEALATDDTLRRELAALKATRHALGQLPHEPAPEGLTDGVMAELERRRLLRTTHEVAHPQPLRWLRRLATAAIVLLTVGLGVYLWAELSRQGWVGRQQNAPSTPPDEIVDNNETAHHGTSNGNGGWVERSMHGEASEPLGPGGGDLAKGRWVKDGGRGNKRLVGKGTFGDTNAGDFVGGKVLTVSKNGRGHFVGQESVGTNNFFVIIEDDAQLELINDNVYKVLNFNKIDTYEHNVLSLAVQPAPPPTRLSRAGVAHREQVTAVGNDIVAYVKPEDVPVVIAQIQRLNAKVVEESASHDLSQRRGRRAFAYSNAKFVEGLTPTREEAQILAAVAAEYGGKRQTKLRTPSGSEANRRWADGRDKGGAADSADIDGNEDHVRRGGQTRPAATVSSGSFVAGVSGKADSQDESKAMAKAKHSPSSGGLITTAQRGDPAPASSFDKETESADGAAAATPSIERLQGGQQIATADPKKHVAPVTKPDGGLGDRTVDAKLGTRPPAAAAAPTASEALDPSPSPVTGPRQSDLPADTQRLVEGLPRRPIFDVPPTPTSGGGGTGREVTGDSIVTKRQPSTRPSENAPDVVANAGVRQITGGYVPTRPTTRAASWASTRPERREFQLDLLESQRLAKELPPPPPGELARLVISVRLRQRPPTSQAVEGAGDAEVRAKQIDSEAKQD